MIQWWHWNEAISGAALPGVADAAAPSADYAVQEVRVIVALPGRAVPCHYCARPIKMGVRTPDGRGWHWNCLEAAEEWRA